MRMVELGMKQDKDMKKEYHISWRTVLEVLVAIILVYNVFAVRSEVRALQEKIQNSTIELKITKEIINAQNE